MEIVNIFSFFSTALVPARYILSILGSIGMAIVYGLKVNLSVALVAMLNHTEIHRLSALDHPKVSINDSFTKIVNLSTSTIATSNDACSSGTVDSATVEVHDQFHFQINLVNLQVRMTTTNFCL